MRFLSVCSGMEAASVAWEPLGWKAVGFSEIEPFPCAILKHRFPNTPNYGSLTEHATWPISAGDVDLLIGGTPCQSYSVAGKRRGLNDPRGQLMLSFLDLAERLKVPYVVWENVPGVLSSGQPRGSDFATFLQGLVERGYGWAYRILDAQHFGVPQRRRRVFVVASLGGRDVAASVLLEPESLCWHPAKGRKKGQATAPDAGSGVEAGLPIWRAGDQANAEHMIDHAGTVNCNKGSHGGFIAQPSTLSHWEGGDIHPTLNQAHNIGSPGYSNQEIFSQKGAGLVPIPFGKSKRACSTTDNESWVEADASNTLNNFDLGDTRTTHAVVEPICFEPRSQDGHARISGDVSPTLNTAQGGQRQPCVAITFQPGNLRREAGADPSTTTTTTLKASAGDQMPHVATPMAVRRLTPTECERLQGFPDNWSRISWKGKPEDQCPDGPRYKACGNSMAVPVMRWIGEQIARVELSHNQPTITHA